MHTYVVTGVSEASRAPHEFLYMYVIIYLFVIYLTILSVTHTV
jgi:hypothetical protein